MTESFIDGIEFDFDLALYGPALSHRSEQYPERFKGRVPKRIRMLKRVTSDIPFSDPNLVAENGAIYTAWTNSHGAVAAWINGKRLGVRPNEFEVIDWVKGQ